jgi:hypothetical protein
MLNKKIRAGAVTLLILSVSSCNNNIPNNTSNKSEYGFETKELTASYLKRKLNFWMDANPVKGDQLVKKFHLQNSNILSYFVLSCRMILFYMTI